MYSYCYMMMNGVMRLCIKSSLLSLKYPHIFFALISTSIVSNFDRILVSYQPVLLYRIPIIIKANITWDLPLFDLWFTAHFMRRFSCRVRFTLLEIFGHKVVQKHRISNQLWKSGGLVLAQPSASHYSRWRRGSQNTRYCGFPPTTLWLRALHPRVFLCFNLYTWSCFGTLPRCLLFFIYALDVSDAEWFIKRRIGSVLYFFLQFVTYSCSENGLKFITLLLQYTNIGNQLLNIGTDWCQFLKSW